jgi:lipoprotein-anchoring transpeptidase ErfK/SrfK
MKTDAVVRACLALLLTLSASAAAGQTPPKNTSTLGTAKTILPAELKPGEYAWHPEFSPNGPIVLIVSLPEQLAYVYRNGVIIGASTVSTGKKGHETPTGVFTILQKHEDHYSNLYNDAPMPYMQRLTWSGVALHAGRLPGYPASHGCVRMPYEFAQLLYGETKTGLTVIVSNEETFPSTVAHPGLVAPVDTKGTLAGELPRTGDIAWQPEAAPEGPVTILITNEDRRIRIFRAGVEIGHAPFTLVDPDRRFTLHVLTRLEPSAMDTVSPATGKPIPRWLAVSGGLETTVTADDLLAVIKVAPEFLRQAETVVGPGTTMVIAQPASTTSTTTAAETDFTVVTGEK